MNRFTTYSLSVIILLFTVSVWSQDLVIYDVPGGYKYSAQNDDFTVQVREDGGEWQDLFEYEVEVDLDSKSKASMVYFDFEGRVEVKVRKNNGLIHEAKIRPISRGIQSEAEGQIITFSLENPTKISLEINGDKLHNLHLFANSIETNKPNPEDPDVIYFGPGVHQPQDQPGDVYNIPSGKTVYVDGGAIVKAKFLIDKAEDVKIMGRGIIMQPERGVEIRHSNNVTVDGLIFINPRHYTIYGGESDDLTISNIKSFSSNGWSDGIDLMSCSDVTIDDVFMRNSDDCIAIYAHRWEFYGSARNYEIKNSMLWADIAHPTNIGLHGNAEKQGDTIENISFKNIDVLEQDEDDRNYQGVMAITGSDKNLIRNITYEDIRIDNIQEGQIFNFRVLFNKKYSHAPGRDIENIRLKNITYTGPSPNPSLIEGFSDEYQVENVSIENLSINGDMILNAEDGDIHIGKYTENIKFQKK
ncbi:glycosyl hydrolase family 28 protein [Autumnicola psychrophila]|uniref:Glycosyl hydrolase family 28 protein n=1 Tax=Autumnicola psychrophila TaxID=3075592 RepID=A0ABU3DM36_9FLAO|nr:glycosyl hydrolase family 28 protein [Zunongwangia sp. F225]MDT0684741.1 glycosyl hydrolase family 28 protein [Zunongwangia sp. F225]